MESKILNGLTMLFVTVFVFNFLTLMLNTYITLEVKLPYELSLMTFMAVILSIIFKMGAETFRE